LSRSRLGLLLVIAMLGTLIPIGVAPAAATTGDLLITGVIQGPRNGANPKAIELVVVNDIPNLGIYGLGSANDGSGTDGQEYTFPTDSVTAGEFIYVSLEGNQFVNFFGFSPDYLTTTVNVNGDDAIELFRSGVVVDVYGAINVDGTGQPWEYVNGWAYRNPGTGADGSTFTPSNWTFSGINTLVGATSTNGSGSNPLFPVGSYVITVPTTTTTTTSTSTTTTTSTTSTTTTTTTQPEPTTTTTTTTTLPEPTPPPDEDVRPPKVKAELDRYWTDHNRGWFRVDFSCRDRVDHQPSCIADINGIPVLDGQKVYLVDSDGETKVYRAHGVLYINAPEFLLTVTGADEAGNTATATAEPRFKYRHQHRWWC